jgi:transcriptional regulator with GAF, ATPase, and Fis domain
MSQTASSLEDTGLEVLDLRSDFVFANRRLHDRDVEVQMAGLRRLTRAFVDSPDTVLQELVDAAVELCGADSAGISLEIEGKTDERYYSWVATAGEYKQFLNATLPRYPSACGVCLERNMAQRFLVNQRFFDIMGIEAPLVTDGLLLPWQVGETRGTIFVMAHGRTEAFDSSDYRMMEALADFAAMAVRHQKLQSTLVEHASAAAAAAMANELAHQINNPLQSLTNLVYVASRFETMMDVKTMGEMLTEPIERLGVLVKRLLEIPAKSGQAKPIA